MIIRYSQQGAVGKIRENNLLAALIRMGVAFFTDGVYRCRQKGEQWVRFLWPSIEGYESILPLRAFAIFIVADKLFDIT